MRKQRFDDRGRVVTTHGLVKGGDAPHGLAIRIGAVSEQVTHARLIVPVVLAHQHRREAVGREASRFDERLDHVAIPRLRRVVGHLAVVGVGAAFEQQARQRRVVRHARGTVERTLEHRGRRVPRLVEAGVCRRTGVEQPRRRADERAGPGTIDTQVAREAQVRERVPAAGPAAHGGRRGICRQACGDGAVVAEDGGGMDRRADDVGMRLPDALRLFEATRRVRHLERHGSGFDEGVDDRGWWHRRSGRAQVQYERRRKRPDTPEPAVKAVGAAQVRHPEQCGGHLRHERHGDVPPEAVVHAGAEMQVVLVAGDRGGRRRGCR